MMCSHWKYESGLGICVCVGVGVCVCGFQEKGAEVGGPSDA